MRMTNLFIIFIMKRSMFSYLLSCVLLKKTQLILRWRFRISLTYLFFFSSFILHSGAHCFTSVLVRFFMLFNLLFCIVLGRSLFVFVSFFSIWPLYRLATVSTVHFQFMASDYPFGIFSSGLCIDCPLSIYGF